jgi:hypothetical protein
VFKRQVFRKTPNFFASSANSSGDILCNAFKSIDAGASGAKIGAVTAVVGRGSAVAAVLAEQARFLMNLWTGKNL